MDEMLNVVKRKKRDDKLNENEVRKLQDLATGVESDLGPASRPMPMARPNKPEPSTG